MICTRPGDGPGLTAVGVGTESLSGSSFGSVMGATPRICPNFMMASYLKINENFPMFPVSENNLEPM
jgi:hypothetical protein